MSKFNLLLDLDNTIISDIKFILTQYTIYTDLHPTEYKGGKYATDPDIIKQKKKFKSL